jgi:hypothetical protein
MPAEPRRDDMLGKFMKALVLGLFVVAIPSLALASDAMMGGGCGCPCCPW